MRVRSLNRLLYLTTLLAGTLATPVRVQAAEVYNNGAPYLGDGAKELNSQVQANDFTLGARTRISSVQFWSLESAGAFAGSIQWQILSDSGNRPGEVLFSGSSTDFARAQTGRVYFNLYREWSTTFQIAPVVLPAGRYWLALHNGPETNTAPQLFYWSGTEQPGAIPSQYRAAGVSGPWFSNQFPGFLSQFAFRILGSPVPEVQGITFSQGMPYINFTSVADEQYEVQFSETLAEASWMFLPGSERTGNGSTLAVADTDPQARFRPRRFYRVVLR